MSAGALPREIQTRGVPTVPHLIVLARRGGRKVCGWRAVVMYTWVLLLQALLGNHFEGTEKFFIAEGVVCAGPRFNISWPFSDDGIFFTSARLGARSV